MNKRGNILEFILGIGVLAAVTYFSVILYRHKGNGLNDTTILKADFDSVDGLSKGSPVKINGVLVGHVKSITLSQDSFSALVTFSINRHITLPKDTIAAIISESLLGSKILSLIPGSEEQTLAPGSIIYSTQSATNLEGLLEKFIFNSGGSSKEDDAETKTPEKKDTSPDAYYQGRELLHESS